MKGIHLQISFNYIEAVILACILILSPKIKIENIISNRLKTDIYFYM